MSRRVTWSREALKDMRRLGSVSADRVGRAVDRYVETGHGDVKPVLGSEIDEKRLKVGKVRVFFTEHPDEVRIDSVKPRDKAYRAREVPISFESSEATARTLTFDESEMTGIDEDLSVAGLLRGSPYRLERMRVS